MEKRKAYFHLLNQNDDSSIDLMKSLTKDFDGKKIIIAIPIDEKELTDDEKIVLGEKKFVMNDVEGISYNILAGKLTGKGKPKDPQGLEEPPLTGFVKGKGKPTDPQVLAEPATDEPFQS